MIICLDLETTGLDTKNDKVIEIAMIKFDSKTFEIIDTYSSFINPEIKLTDFISNLTNISDNDLKKAPLLADILDDISEFIWDNPILWHNIYFDIDFLESNWLNLRQNVIIDTFLISNFLFFDKHSLSLESLADILWIEFNWAHRAINDVKANIKLFEYQIKEINKFKKEKKEILKYILQKSEDKWFNFLALNYLFDNTINIDKTIFLKYFIKFFKKTPKIKEKENLKIKEKEFNFDKIIDNIDKLELRENQLKMSNLINDWLNDNKKLVIEAPTGVWKTFAYLIPSIIYSLKNNKQIFISTSTKALQDQIFYKDLDFLKNNLDLNFTYSKLKWKSNYIWIYSFIRFFDLDETFSAEKTSFLLKIIFWLYSTKSFELDELDFYPKEFQMQREIDADNLLTFSSKNLYSNREPLVIQRKLAKKSDIVIINNNILFQDIDSWWTILSKPKNIIIDEAHNLEDVVTNSLKKSVSLIDLDKNFNFIKKTLLLNKLEVSKFEDYIDQLKFNLETLFWLFEDYLNWKLSNELNYKKALLKADFYEKFIGDIDINSIILSIMSTIVNIKDLLALLPDNVYLDINKHLNYILLFEEVLSTLKNKDKLLEDIIILNSNSRWFFIEKTILNPWEFLEKSLWNNLDTCILTSATLKTNDDFDYITNILSLNWFNFYELKSDFDYSKQALLYVPDNLGNIKNNITQIIDFLEKFILVVKWRTLVLFTALFMIKEVYKHIYWILKENNINLYAQWVAWWKHKLINFYKKNVWNSVLLGTDTFWEGIDLSWDDLKYLIIHKIPFMVPNDPIFQARSSLFTNSFLEYSLPKAILKLKQWFWRLIRTKNDSWIVVFLDDRIYSTSWWKTLFSAFPNNIKYKKWNYNLLIDVLKNKNIEL